MGSTMLLRFLSVLLPSFTRMKQHIRAARFHFTGMLKERKFSEAIRSFFRYVYIFFFCDFEIRASSGERASKHFQAFSQDTGLPPLCLGKLVTAFVLSLCSFIHFVSYPSGREVPSVLIGVLVQENLYDTTFTVILKFRKGSALRSTSHKALTRNA
ncbi:unnamed protein product [Linum tenue]|uniref:Secreted protein n=1 Tax=Linum tenue TaxID=586396 RepID=A0AAV0NP66_9ROSI|nr:unnamed protein product [Linum tenue]